MDFWKAIWRFEYGLAALGAGLCLIVIMLITVASVIGRYFLQIDLIPGGYNIIERIFFPLLVFMAVPIAHREGTFPRFELLADTLPDLPRKLIAVLVVLVEAMVYAVLFWLVIRFTANAIDQQRTMQIGTGVVVMWPVLIFVPLMIALVLLEALRLLWRDLRAFV